ncbi:MAG: type II toxin-antitoxin system RelE/ParE family toxin [Candidatus Lokiarchaeota archaeon]|nr:type II toxin-antitoxin system RelE/ParE family toxin [Candidatus Lokiarchaeota archaeon]
MYKVVFTAKARRQIIELPRLVAKRIAVKIEELAADPSAQDIKKLAGMDLYRLRVGDYRVIFDLKHEELLIVILNLGHRKEIYK